MDFEEGLNLIFHNKLKKDEPLKNHCTIHTGGLCKYFISASNVLEMSRMIELCDEYNVNCKIIGSGSNLLFSDKGYNGVIISTENFSQIKVEEGVLKVFSGTKLSELIDFCLKLGFYGLEKLYGIPATVGGAVCQNASSFGTNISDYIYKVESIKNGKYVRRLKSDCDFSYRNSVFKGKKEIITVVTFSSFKREKEGKEVYLNKRRLIQPCGFSFGSVFKNPYPEFSADLIEKTGLKGFGVGGAKVSEKHANFIINYNNASSSDVYAIIKEIKKRVYDKFGVNLTEEVEYVGEF